MELAFLRPGWNRRQEWVAIDEPETDYRERAPSILLPWKAGLRLSHPLGFGFCRKSISRP